MDLNINININNNLKKFKIDFILLGIISLAMIIRFYNLGFQSPWLDELSTIMMSDPDLTTARSHELILTREGFPDLYFFSLKFLSQIFGHSIYTLRFFSAFFGTLSVYIMYLWAKEIFSKNTGYIAALLLTVNFFHIYHSQEARAYSLLVFFVILANYRLIKFIKNINLKNAILLGITTGLIANAHPVGVLNDVAIAVFLLVFLIIEPKKLERIKIFKFSLLVGLLTLIMFLPVYPLFSRASEIKAFWIPKPSFETIKQAFFELLGGSNVSFYSYLIGFFVFCGLLIFKRKEENKVKNKYIIAIVIIWFLVNVGIILAKSYLDVSIILNRYFIGVLPLFIIALSYILGSIKNKIISYSLACFFVSFSLYFLVFTKTYYSAIIKSQWDVVTKEIIKNNSQKDKILGTYGYVVNALYLKTNSEGLGWEITLEDYVKNIKSNAREKESFWYIDGNFRPFNLSQEDIDYLDQHYVIDHQIDKYDCWAKHYKLKTESSLDSEKKTYASKIYLTDFDSKIFDNLGNLLLFENKTIIAKPISLEKGKYQLVLNANSLPTVPIDNINAHILIKNNNQLIGDCYLSEKENKKENVFNFNNQSESSVFTITFDNDISKNEQDRNIIIYSIDVKKID